LRELIKCEELFGHGFVDGLTLEISDRLILPLVWPAHRAQIREEKLEFQVKVGIQVLWLDVDLRAEQPDIVNFHFLLTIPDEESS
jgi:hypothetical protein